MAEETNVTKKELTGTVVSNKMQDTVVVAVERFVKHPKYGKFIRRTKKYKAHAPGLDLGVGEKVVIRECAPVSKDKHFTVVTK